MNVKLALLFTLITSLSQAQTFKFPILVNQGKTIKSLAPAQWKAVDSVYGDLNHDQMDDLAVIYEFYAPVKENRAYGDNSTELITEIQRPRILGIYFKSGKTYRLAVQNNNFILRSEEGGAMGDPLRPMSINANKLNIAFEGGGNWRWKLNYFFRYQHQDWVLTNANHYTYQNGSTEMTEKQYDFINKKRKTVTGKTGPMTDDQVAMEQAFPLKTMKNLSNFKKPWTWEIGPDEYL